MLIGQTRYAEGKVYTKYTNTKRKSVELYNVQRNGASVSLGEQGWCSGESTHLPPMWPGFDSWTRRHMCVEFVVGSLLCSERFFSRYSGFPLSSKTNISKFQFDPGMHGHVLNEFLRTPKCSMGKQITFTFFCIVSLKRVQNKREEIKKKITIVKEVKYPHCLL